MFEIEGLGDEVSFNKKHKITFLYMKIYFSGILIISLYSIETLNLSYDTGFDFD